MPENIPESMPEPENAAPPAKKKFDIARELFDWSQALVHAIIVIVLMFAFAVSLYTVKGPSMEDTLHGGEMLAISNLFYTPERGDIVIFAYYGLPEAYDKTTGRYEPFVKRVMGLPGDTVAYEERDGKTVVVVRDGADEIVSVTDSKGKELPIDGHPARDDFLGKKGVMPTEPIPEGQLFVMGDNRNDSMDSRSFGPIDSRFVLGRVLFRVTPFSKFGAVLREGE